MRPEPDRYTRCLPQPWSRHLLSVRCRLLNVASRSELSWSTTARVDDQSSALTPPLAIKPGRPVRFTGCAPLARRHQGGALRWFQNVGVRACQGGGTQRRGTVASANKPPRPRQARTWSPSVASGTSLPAFQQPPVLMTGPPYSGSSGINAALLRLEVLGDAAANFRRGLIAHANPPCTGQRASAGYRP